MRNAVSEGGKKKTHIHTTINTRKASESMHGSLMGKYNFVYIVIL